MPKKIKLEAHLRTEELENRYRKAKDPVLRSHYQILWLISEGKSTTEVMEVSGYERGWIQQPDRRYNLDGPEVLGDGRHRNPGARRRALLDASQQRDLTQALQKQDKSGKKVSSKRQRGWEYLKKLGNSPKVPRFHRAKANELQQEVFKKLPMRVMRLKEAYPTAKVEL